MGKDVETSNPKLEGIDYSKLVLVHATNREPEVNEKGNLEIKSAFHSAGGFEQKTDPEISDLRKNYGVSTRPSVHFTIQEPVTDHAYGSFEGREYLVFSPMKEAIQVNGRPESFISSDVAFFAPEKAVELPGSVVVKFDRNGELSADEFAKNVGGVLVVSREITDENRQHAISLLRAAEERAPNLGAAEAAEFAGQASGNRAAVEVAKTLALNTLEAPSINKQLGVQFESNLSFDGWSSYKANEDFIKSLPIPSEEKSGIYIGRHGDSLGNELNDRLRRGDIAGVKEVSSAAAGVNKEISEFAGKLAESELMRGIFNHKVMAELANPKALTENEFGQSQYGMARTLYSRGEPFYDSPYFGRVTREDADRAIEGATKTELLAVKAALIERGMTNSGDKFINELIEKSPSWGEVTKPPMQVFKELENPMPEKYTLVYRDGDEKKTQTFQSGKEAGEAFHNAPAEMSPSVIKTQEKGGASIIASTLERQMPEGEKTFQKSVNGQDKEFREGWQKAEDLQRERSYARDDREGVQSGMLRIDGREAVEVRVYRKDDAAEAKYDVEFYAKRDMPHGQAFAQHRDLDRSDLETAIGEKNAKTVRESGEASMKLAGEKLAYEVGYSPAEFDRMMFAKEDRKSREMDQMLLDRYGPGGMTSHPKAPVVELVKYKENADGAERMAVKAEEGKSYQGKVIAVTEQHIIQRQVEPKTGKERDVAHDKVAVSGFSQEKVGREVEISYPHGKAGIARDVTEKAASEKQAEHQHGRNEPGKDRDR